MKKPHFKAILLLIVLMVFSACATKQSHINFKPYQFEDGQYEPGVQNFMIIIDASDSMDFSHNGVEKFTAAKDAVTYINQTLPNLKIKGALRSFGHKQKVSNDKTVLQFGLTEYTKAGLEKGLDQLNSPGGNSPLATALDAAIQDLESASGKIGVIIISDGQDMKEKPILSAQEMKEAFGDRICIHSLHIGNSPEGKILMKKISEIGECGSYSELDKLVAENRMPDFIQTVFLTKFSDKDRDGIPDAKDRCPGTPADIKVNDDGCPIDSDGDGVSDYKDRCPGTPRQIQVNSFGCPVDSDGDGVTDDIDKCPNTKAGMTVDTYGCPLPVASKSATVTESGTWIYKGIQFPSGKWDIKKESHAVLDEIVRTIQTSPNLKLEVQGHTDSMGNEASNYRLSGKRAKAVMDYLLRKGVSPAQLTYKGYGPSMPIASNDTPAGRSENRRVELKPIQ